jgi:biotin carboxyl carrier protein
MKEKTIELEINGQNYTVVINEFNAYEARLTVNGKAYKVGLKDLGIEQVAEIKPKLDRSEPPRPAAPLAEPKLHRPKSVVNASSILAPLPGLIQRIHVRVGEEVKAGQTVIIMEAMKMENEIQAVTEGVVKEIKVREGDSVNEADVLIVLE